MSQLNKKPLHYSILITAMLSLSACSTSPKVAGVDLGSVGSGIGKIGNKTKELSVSAWEGTKDFLNIGPQEPELLDEVDLALMEEDADLAAVELASAADTQELLPQGDINSPILVDASQNPIFPDGSASNESLAFGEIPNSANTEIDASGDVIVLASTDGPALEQAEDLLRADTKAILVVPDTNNAMVATKDLTHEVNENETLWEIAKTTTGDANNWHIIADINDLAPDAAVYPGMKLLIPADMLKEDVSEPVAVAVAVTQTPTTQAPAVQQSAAVTLTIPAKNPDAVTTDAVVAAAEQIKPTQDAKSENLLAEATALKVGSGETLWDFAKRTTGDATNWKAIADKNLFDEQQATMIRPGQKIYVPNEMVRYRDDQGVLIAKGEEGTIPTATIGGVIPTDATAIEATAAVLAGTNQPPEQGDIKIVEAAYQDDSAVKPVTPETLSAEASESIDNDNSELGKVMITGTYYPKAVYHGDDFSSGVLTRVSPGTQLQVSKAIGPWLEVQTDMGTGYVHSRDIK